MNLEHDRNIDLDLWRPIYKPGDKVWILAKGGIYEGEVLTRYASSSGREAAHKVATKKMHAMYYVYCRMAHKIHAGVSRRKYSLYIRGTQLVPRMGWEERPLQRIEMLLNMEVDSARVRHFIEQLKTGRPGEAPRGGDAPGP
jgi:hypothetical protein